MADERYAKVVNKDGRDILFIAPKDLPERTRERCGYLPLRVETRDRTKQVTGRRPVQRDGFVELTWVYA